MMATLYQMTGAPLFVIKKSVTPAASSLPLTLPSAFRFAEMASLEDKIVMTQTTITMMAAIKIVLLSLDGLALKMILQFVPQSAEMDLFLETKYAMMGIKRMERVAFRTVLEI